MHIHVNLLVLHRYNIILYVNIMLHDNNYINNII